MPVSESSEPIHIAVACDENYAMPLAAMLASLLAHLDPRRTLTIHVLGSSLTQQTWRDLQSTVSEKRIQWNRIEMDTSRLIAQGFSTRAYEHISAACFLLLLLPELLPADLEKVLYLDCDLIVCQDISGLWRTDIRDVPLAAVTEWGPGACTASSPGGVLRYHELGMPAEQPLFNAGVLLLNLAYWRQSRLAQRAFVYVRQIGPDLRWYEQEALNVVTDGRYRELEPRWNVPADVAAQLPHAQVSIVHYLTDRKPWHWYFDSAQSTLFFEALDRTPWAGWRPERPRHGATKQLIIQFAKALQKRLHAVRRIRWKLRLKLDYWRASLKLYRLRDDGPRLDVACCEIRLFLTAPKPDVDLVQTLTAYFGAGIKRAFVLIDSDAREAAVIPDRYAKLVHVFTCQEKSIGLSLRHLLHRYGQSHWCVLGSLCEVIVDSAATTVNLGDLCADLDATNSEVLEAASGVGEQIELVARDVRSNRVFRGTAHIARSAHSYDLPAFVSRTVLVKYASHILLDAGARIAGNARKSTRCLALKRLDRPSAS